jgi:hypothetical protein
MKLTACAAMLAAAMAATTCSRPAWESNLIELQRVRLGDLEVVLLSNDGTLTHDKDSLTLEFRRGDDLVDVGTVEAAATMPMAGLPEMQGSVFLERSDVPGRYNAETDLSMSGGWNLRVEWDGPTGKGSASFSATVE